MCWNAIWCRKQQCYSTNTLLRNLVKLQTLLLIMPLYWPILVLNSAIVHTLLQPMSSRSSVKKTQFMFHLLGTWESAHSILLLPLFDTACSFQTKQTYGLGKILHPVIKDLVTSAFTPQWECINLCSVEIYCELQAYRTTFVSPELAYVGAEECAYVQAFNHSSWYHLVTISG